VYYAIAIPLRVATVDINSLYYIIDYFCDALFLLDCYFNMNTFATFKDGDLISIKE
jgi:hypothetical protein